MASDDASDRSAGGPSSDVGFEIWKARQARKADIDVAFDERWKDKMLVGILLFVCVHSYILHSLMLTSYTGNLLFRCTNCLDSEAKDRSHPQREGLLQAECQPCRKAYCLGSCFDLKSYSLGL